MRLTSAFRAFQTTLASVGLLLLGACAVPLGPAYKVEREQIEVRFVPGPSAHLTVRVAYQLMNTGNQTLSFVELGFLEAGASARQRLQFWLDGRGVAAQSVSESPTNAFHIPVDAPWLQKQRHEVAVSYELMAGAATSSGMTIGAEAFYLGPQAWAPVLRAPRGAFAAGGERPDTTELTVRVPQEFLAHASGRAAGARKQNGEMELHFRVRPRDFDPFVVAGRYHEQPVRTHQAATVIFWTLQPLTADQAQRAGGRLTATIKTYETLWGPRGAKQSPVWVVQWPAAGGVALPGVVLQGGAWAFDEAFLSDIEAKLASTWFHYLARPRPDSLSLADALSHYAVFVAAESRGEATQRQSIVASLLSGYDDAGANLKAESLSSMTRADSSAQRRVNSLKARLFPFALEDHCGKEALRRALARVIRARRTNEWAVEDFRSALEAETGQNLGEFFRVWLNRPGVPDDFRARYQDKIQQK